MEKKKVVHTDIKLENKITSLGGKMANYKTCFTHIREWIHHKALLYGNTYIMCLAQCDWAAATSSQ